MSGDDENQQQHTEGSAEHSSMSARPKFDSRSQRMRNADSSARGVGSLVAGVDKLLVSSKSTGVLNLSDRGLSEIPRAVFDEEDPDAAENVRAPVQTISFDAPDSGGPAWWEVKELTALVASHNSITQLPVDVANLTALQRLDLGHNQLESLPATALASLPLRSLDVSDNKLRMLPDTLPVETLAVLNVSRNPKLFKLPEAVGACARLAEVRATGCALTELPRAIDMCTSLVTLDISSNRIGTLPDGMTRLASLRELNVSCNALTALPRDVGAMVSLTRLDCRENRIACVPSSISSCSKLAEIFIGRNELTMLPEALGTCAALATLDVSSNRLKELPASLASGAPFRTIDASGNEITRVAPELGRCVSLRRLALEGNPLRSIRQNILTGPVGDLLGHLRSKLGAEENGVGAAFRGDESTARAEDVSRAVATAARVASEGGRSSGVSLRGQRLERLPDDFWSVVARGVTSVDLGENGLLDGVDAGEVERCDGLETLLLDGNALERWPLPRREGRPLALTELNLAGNKGLSATMLPGAFSRATRLQKLDLTGIVFRPSCGPNLLAPLSETLTELRWGKAMLDAIPDEVFNLRKLRVLRFNDNRIRELSPAVSLLDELDELDLTNNDLGTLPPELGLLTRLRWLGVEGNMLRMIRRPVIERGTKALLEYLRDKLPESFVVS